MGPGCRLSTRLAVRGCLSVTVHWHPQLLIQRCPFASGNPMPAMSLYHCLFMDGRSLHTRKSWLVRDVLRDCMRRFFSGLETDISLGNLADVGQGRWGRQYVLVVLISWKMVVRQCQDIRSLLLRVERSHGACPCAAGRGGRVHRWVRIGCDGR